MPSLCLGHALKILLIGNYIPDAQESMLRYAALLHEALAAAGHQVDMLTPRAVLNRACQPPEGVWKWLGYLDKYLLGAPALRAAVSRADVMHVCDHSNAVYVPRSAPLPCVVTCHDLLAVRGGLGEDTDCPASFFGTHLQKSILSGLRRADGIACVSQATLVDAQRLLGSHVERLALVPLAMHHPYSILEESRARARLLADKVPIDLPFILHVGSNQRRKNRECVIRTLGALGARWRGNFVFAGKALTAEMKELAASLGVADRIIEVVKPSNELLEALYNATVALLFPSRFEGFGWPILEAQACGCPVICSDRAPFPEVSGGAAIMRDADDAAGFAEAILELQQQPERRENLRHRGLANAARYSREKMARHFSELYEDLLCLARPTGAVA